MPFVVASFDCPRHPVRIGFAESYATLHGLARLYGWSVQPALGSFEGQTENAIVIEGHNLVDGTSPMDVLLDLFKAAGQECILRIDGRGFASLVSCVHGGPPEQLGRWIEVHGGRADPRELDQVRRRPDVHHLKVSRLVDSPLPPATPSTLPREPRP